MKQKIISLILVLIGAIFLALTLPGILRSMKMKKHGVTAEGIVLNVKRMGSKTQLEKVTVSFTDSEGRQVEASASKRENVSQGEKVKVWYDPADPLKIDFGDAAGYNMRGLIAGAIIISLGLFLFIRSVIQGSTEKRLISTGRKISAEFVSVGKNEKYRMGDKNPWVIKCRWTDDADNVEYFFVSKDYTIDPTPYIAEVKNVDIYIDPENPGIYIMDDSFMPKGNITIG